jgi:predicted dehydrogenase
VTPRIGLIGAGTMGRTHLLAWRAAGVEPIGVSASRPERAQAFASEHDLRAYRGFDELLETCDAVDLCVPTDLHAPLALRAARAGRDVVCEKPLALGVEQGRAMIEACDEHGVLLLVAQVLRFFPAYRRARELIAAGELGALTRLELRRASSVPAEGWYRDAERSGGLALDLLVHDADYACWLLGAPSAVVRERVIAPSGSSLSERVRLHLRWPSAAEAVLDGSWDVPGSITRFRIEGTTGVLEGQVGSLALGRLHRPGEAVSVPLDAGSAFELQARHLAAALRRETAFEVRSVGALTAVAVCTGAIGSGAAGGEAGNSVAGVGVAGSGVAGA